MQTQRKFKIDRRFFLHVLLICIGLVPLLLMAHHVRKNWIPIPFWDEWHTPGSQFESWCRGTLTIKELFSQHNESRKFFPRILYFALASVGGWDVRRQMAVVFLEVCLLTALLWRLLRRTNGATPTSALIAWAIMMSLCFSSAQLEIFLWGIQLETFLPGVALVAMATVNLSALSLRTKTLINITLAFIATYTYANGMSLWVLGLPLPKPQDPISRRSKILCYGAYFFAAALAIGAYFIGYTKPSYHPAFASLSRSGIDLLHYSILWVGSYFSSDYVSPFVFGILAWVLFITVIGWAVTVVVQTRDLRPFYSWFLIAAYALLTTAATAFGRVGFGVKQALDSRYTVFSLFFYLALVGTAFALYCVCFRHEKSEKRAVFLTSAAWIVLLTAACWIACDKKNLGLLRFHREYRVKLIRALEWMDPIPDNPDLALVFPHVDVLRERARILAQHRILRLPFIKQPLAAQVLSAPPTGDGSNGVIETCGFDSNHSLFITGWAWLPARNQRADCVVIVCRDAAGNFKPMTVLETGILRFDLRERFHVPNMSRAGFSRTVNPANIPAGDVTIAGWAVDLKGEKALPLASSLTLHQ